jgi:RNA polymerase sigma-70 factor (ECF subfamily)
VSGKAKKNSLHDIHIDLVKASKKNDRKAQIRLYELYSKTMYNTSLRIVKDTQWAEDITQESFLSAFSALKNFREEVPFGIWLRRIVINKSLDELRRQKPVFEELKESELEVDEQIDWEEIEKENKQLVQAIKKAHAELPDGYRIILSLSLFEGYDHEEISKILNISPSTSRSQLARAKKRLVEKLKGSI